MNNKVYIYMDMDMDGLRKVKTLCKEVKDKFNYRIDRLNLHFEGMPKIYFVNDDNNLYSGKV